MSATLEWWEVAFRLALSVAAGVVLGLNRTEGGKAAGMRTTVLVTLAAATAMIQANLLLTTAGKAADSFVQIDPMRLPLGILTGMGFIGAGAVLRRRGAVQGVTTAATLWASTIVGLCLGGGQYGLGLASLALAAVALPGLTWVEARVPQSRRATLTLHMTDDGPSESHIEATLRAAGYSVTGWDLIRKKSGPEPARVLRCEARWQVRPHEQRPPPFLNELLRQPGVTEVRWVE